MAGTYYSLRDEDARGGTYTASVHTTGPWDARLQHGGPPAALLVRAAERAAAADTGRADLVAARIGAEFAGPVPVGEVEVRTRVIRAARSAVLVAATLAAAGRDSLQARVWLVAERDTAGLGAPVPEAVRPPGGLPGLQASFPYGDSIEWREVSGSIAEPGPGVVWARPRMDLLPGEPLRGLQRAVLVADSASGISSELDWATWSFVNVDLDVHLARPFRGEWVHLDARTQLGTHGAALARSTISDVHGVVGASAQTLVLAPVRPSGSRAATSRPGSGPAADSRG